MSLPSSSMWAISICRAAWKPFWWLFLAMSYLCFGGLGLFCVLGVAFLRWICANPQDGDVDPLSFPAPRGTSTMILFVGDSSFMDEPRDVPKVYRMGQFCRLGRYEPSDN